MNVVKIMSISDTMKFVDRRHGHAVSSRPWRRSSTQVAGGMNQEASQGPEEECHSELDED